MLQNVAQVPGLNLTKDNHIWERSCLWSQDTGKSFSLLFPKSTSEESRSRGLIHGAEFPRRTYPFRGATAEIFHRRPTSARNRAERTSGQHAFVSSQLASPFFHRSTALSAGRATVHRCRSEDPCSPHPFPSSSSFARSAESIFPRRETSPDETLPDRENLRATSSRVWP